MRPIEYAIVRVLRPTGPESSGLRTAEGAGFLIDNERHILSCHHVVAACLLPPDPSDGPTDIVEVDFPFTNPPSGVLKAKVNYMVRNDKQDVAGLTLLSDAPPGASPATLIERADIPEHRFKAYGVVGKEPTGEWSFGVIRPGLGENFIHLEATHAQGRRVRRGYSGTAVYDLDAQGVAGMVVQADSQDTERVAMMLPTRLLLNTWSDVLSRAVVAPNPYMGIQPFTELDSDRFFGRDATTRELVKMVQERRFTALMAESGAGKSSVLRAGLIPAMRKRGWLLIHVVGSSRDPYESFAAALLNAEEKDHEQPFTQRRDSLAESLAKRGIHDEVEHLCERTGSEQALVILDQMEELFTVCRDDGKRRAYLDHLFKLTEERRRGGVRVALVISAREDFRARLEEDNKLGRLIKANLYTLPRLDSEALRRAIEEPALGAGVRFADGLVESIIKDVQDRPGTLPLLEYALTLLWNEQEKRFIPEGAYQRIGGVDRALAIEAERAYEELDDLEKEAARRVFVQLTNLSRDTVGTRRLVTKKDLLKGDWNVVEKLSYRMLVSVGLNAAGESTAQLAHETLIDAWPRLREWVDSTAEQVWHLDRKADRVIRWHVAASPAAAAIPWGDIAAAALLYGNMGHKIGKVYGVELDNDAVKTIAIAMAQGMATVAVTWLAMSNAFKMTGIGYAASWIIEAPVLSTLTYVAGNTWQYYFRIRYLGGGAPSNDEMKRLVSEDARNRLASLNIRKRLLAKGARRRG